MARLKQFKFKAIVSLDACGEQQPGEQYAAGTHSLMVRAPYRHIRGVRRYFPAIIARDDGRSLKPGDSDVVVTVAVADDEACDYFCPGQPITLWNGSDVGHGTISRRAFFS